MIRINRTDIRHLYGAIKGYKKILDKGKCTTDIKLSKDITYTK